MRMSDWSSDVCSSDRGGMRYFLPDAGVFDQTRAPASVDAFLGHRPGDRRACLDAIEIGDQRLGHADAERERPTQHHEQERIGDAERTEQIVARSEEHTSELQSLMRISYAVFCLKKKKKNTLHYNHTPTNTT